MPVAVNAFGVTDDLLVLDKVDEEAVTVNFLRHAPLRCSWKSART